MIELEKYKLAEELGRGGYGTVYRALDITLEVDRAIKVLHPVLAADMDFIERFKREARFAARLEHPHIVPVYKMDEENGHYYLVMKYMAGGSLKEKLAKFERLSFETAQNITQQVGDALDYAHRQELIHRDVKPGNILLEEDGATARLTDFGFAKAMQSASSATLSRTGGMVGTPAYMAPELWSGKQASPATDLYSLACVFYEMLIGEPLFTGETPSELIKQHIMDHPHYPEEWPEDVPQGIEEVLNRALAKEPQDRYANMGEFLDTLQGLIKKTPPTDEKEVVAELYEEPAQQACENCGRTYATNLEKCPYCDPEMPIKPERKNASTPVITGVVIFFFIIIFIFFIVVLSNANNRAQQYKNNLDSLSKKMERTEEYYEKEEENYKTEIESYSVTLEAFKKAATRETKSHATQEAQNMLLFLLESKKHLESGPKSGNITHDVDEYVATIRLADSVTDFILEGVVDNPFSSQQHSWDFGIMFRQYEGNDQYRLVIESDASWAFLNVEGDTKVSPLGKGTINNLNTGTGESNKIRLICQGERGWFFINDVFISELDLSARSESGQVIIGTGMMNDNELEGEQTGYHDMTVWSLDDVQESTPDS